MSDPTPNAANVQAVDDLLASIPFDCADTVPRLRAAILAALEEKDAEWSKTFHEELDNEREGPKSQGLVLHGWETIDPVWGSDMPIVHFGWKPPPGHILDDTGAVRKVLGTLPVTADGCVAIPCVSVVYQPRHRERRLDVDTCSDRVIGQVAAPCENVATEWYEYDIGETYSTREAASAAKEVDRG